MIEQVVVNYTERNYFNDYDEVRSDRMTSISPEKVRRAIDKLVRRFRGSGTSDVMFVKYSDNTGYRLMYQKVGIKSYEHPVLGTMYKGGEDKLTLRHFTNYEYEGWDKEEAVTIADAKRLIIGKE